jgi:hypothetical protein
VKHGWAFLADLTRSIEAWSDDIQAHDPNDFAYRGADLRHAAERSLFFALANDEALMAYFDALVEGALPPALPENSYRSMVLPYLGRAVGPSSLAQPQIPWSKRLRARLGNLSRLGRSPFRTARLNTANFLFLAIHPKFVGFMGPVAKQLGGAFLSFNDSVMETHLEQAGLSFVALRPSYSSWRIPGVLWHFAFLCRAFDEMTAMMGTLRPRVIVVPEGNAPIYEIAHRAGLQRGVKTVCLQQGAPAYTNPGFRNWSFADVFVWGEAFVEPFARHNPHQHFTVTGTPATLPRPRMASGNAPVRSIGFFLQKGAIVIQQEEWHALLRFIGWTASNHPNIQVIVRDHPSQAPLTEAERELFGKRPNLRFMPPPHHASSDVLAASDIVIAAASTTLLEAVQVGAIPFIFGTAYPRDFPDILAAGAGVIASDLDTAKAVLTQIIVSTERRANLRAAGAAIRSTLFAANGAEGTARIAAALAAAAR